jgi:hypothetical protein
MKRKHWQILAEHTHAKTERAPFTDHYLCNELYWGVKDIPAHIAEEMTLFIGDNLRQRQRHGALNGALNGFLILSIDFTTFITPDVNEARILFCLFMALDTANDTE